MNDLLEHLAELNPEALIPDGLEDARDGMTYEDADEFLQFNTLGAYVGENGPFYVEMRR